MNIPDEWKDFLDEDRQIHVDLWLSANEEQLSSWYDNPAYAAGQLAASDPDVLPRDNGSPDYVDGFCDELERQIEAMK
jgi:hypothetical protein